MRISIAMCTYNGEKFVRDELASFLTQTRLPDELVICDDRSSDRTVEIVEEFARTAPFDVRLSVNKRNLKYPKNFEQAISLTRGDLIVPADWDDVWLPQKLERLETAASSSADVGMVFSDAHVVDGQLRPTGVSLWQARGFRFSDRSFLSGESLLVGHVSATYATTMAFKAQYKVDILPLPEEWHADDTRVGLAPDTWITVIISSMARVALVPEPLVKYRQHGNNESGAGEGTLVSRIRAAQSNDAETFLERARRWRLASERLADLPKADPAFLDHVRRIEQHNFARARAAQGTLSRFPLVGRELANGRYRRYSNGWHSAAADLIRRSRVQRM